MVVKISMVLGVAGCLFLFRRKFGVFVLARIAFGCYYSCESESRRLSEYEDGKLLN